MGVWEWDLVSNDLIWDESMFHLFGIKPQDFNGTYSGFEINLLPQDINTLQQDVNLAIQGKKQFDTQFRIQRRGELRHLRAAGLVLRSPSGQPRTMIGVNWDITDRVRANELLQHERAKSVAASKMASLGEMASGIAHEINNPLTIISARAGQLKSRIEKNNVDLPQFAQDLDRIEVTVHRIAKIIRGLRSFSRNGEEDPFTRCSLKQIFEEALELCRERFTRTGVTIESLDCEDVEIECRSVQILQVLVNLLNNSFDAVISLPQPKWIRLTCKTESNRVVIRVKDSGHGIPSDIVDRLMEPFFTTKPVGQGTGLGLSISKGIIEEHHGKFWVNTESRNTEFVLELPLRQPASKVD